jgi:hypothetical protein
MTVTLVTVSVNPRLSVEIKDLVTKPRVHENKVHPCTGTEVMVKVTLVQALWLCTGRTAYRGSRGITLPFHDHRTRRR